MKVQDRFFSDGFMLQIFLCKKPGNAFLLGVTQFFSFRNALSRYSWYLSVPGLLCLVAFLQVAHLAEAAVSEHLVYSSYKVKADASRPLSIILNEATPHRESDMVFHAFTVWKVKWKYRHVVGADGRCGIKGFRTYLYADIDLPDLHGATGTQQEQFGHYLTALRAHELGHYSIGKEAALAFDNRIHSMPARRSCTLLASSVKKLAQQISGKYHELEMQYDTSTENGKLQGVQLDW